MQLSSLLSTLRVSFLLVRFVRSSSVPETLDERDLFSVYTFPFDRIVAFGDELSDTGTGSSAHGISGSPANIYGYGTWTNGPTAVQYLANNLNGASLTSYAWGGCCDGNQFGATIHNGYTPSQARYKGASVPSVADQISNYTASHPQSVGTTLGFIWAGQNDLSWHTNAFNASDPENAAFVAQIAKRTVAEAERLATLGMKYVFVANLYPKHRAPVTIAWLCPDGSCADTLNGIIMAANTAIQSALGKSKYASRFIYYDVYDAMLNILNGGFQQATYYCDGDVRDPNQKWAQCLNGSYVGEGASQFYWISLVQPTTVVHQDIARDMAATIESFLGFQTR